jgi:hypothetical protein
MNNYRTPPYGRGYIDQSSPVETHAEYLARLEREAEANRKANEEAKQRWQAKLAAERKEREDRQAAEEENRINAAIVTYRRQARAAFPGSDAQFEQQWPHLLADWQRDQVRQAHDANMALVRARFGNRF